MIGEAKCCKLCKWWDIDSARSKSGRVMSDRPAKCLWQFKMAMPSSITRKHDWRIPVGGYMEAKEGESCPTFQKREVE